MSTMLWKVVGTDPSGKHTFTWSFYTEKEALDAIERVKRDTHPYEAHVTQSDASAERPIG